MSTPPIRPWRSTVAGGLAGASGAISLMMFYVFVLSIGLFWQYAYLRNVPVLGEQADDMVIENLALIHSFLAGWSEIALVLVIVGVGLALIEQQNHLIAPEWQGRTMEVAAPRCACSIRTSSNWAKVSQSAGAIRSVSNAPTWPPMGSPMAAIF
jgi:hypothetical protein